MKQCFTHRLPSHLTLLSDPWPEDFSEARDKVEQMMKTTVLTLKNPRRKARAKAD